MAEHKYLDLLRTAGAAEQKRSAPESDQQEVEQSQRHETRSCRPPGHPVQLQLSARAQHWNPTGAAVEYRRSFEFELPQ